MRKQAVSFRGETTPSSEVSGGKRPKRSSLDEEAKKSPTVITVDSPERASDVLLTLEGVAQHASREACASLEDGVPAEGALSPNRVVRGTLSGVAVGLVFLD